jgi:hypothetical protein
MKHLDLDDEQTEVLEALLTCTIAGDRTPCLRVSAR